MSKKQRLNELLNRFNEQEQEFLMSLGRNNLYVALDMEHDNDMLEMQLRNAFPALQAKQAEKQAEKQEIAKEKQAAKRERERIEVIEPIELYVPKMGRIEIEKNVFSLFCDTFKFSFNEAKRRVVNLYIYYPKKSPLIALKIAISEPEILFYESLEEYLILNDESKNWSTFVGIFSKTVFEYLESIGNKTIRRQPEKQHVINDCYVYDADGELIRIIEAPKKEKKHEEFTHASFEAVCLSLEELRERELNQLDEFGEELEA